MYTCFLLTCHNNTPVYRKQFKIMPNEIAVKRTCKTGWTWTLWFVTLCLSMMTSSDGSNVRVTGHLWGGIHQTPVNSPHKGQWRGALMFSLSCIWINGWVNNRKAGDLRRYRTHYDVTVILCHKFARKPKYLKKKSCYTMIILNCRTNLVLWSFSMLWVGVFLIIYSYSTSSS